MMSVRIQPHGNAAVVTAERRLVVGNRQALKSAVVHELENGRRTVVIDLGETDLIDSGGLGVLVTLYRQAEEVGGVLVLANLSDELSGLLRLTKLDTIFTVAGTVEDALQLARGRSEAAPEPEHPEAPQARTA
jgi:anti-sigma B factor antagonist